MKPCPTGKVQYTSIRQAAREIRRLHREEGRVLRSYQCRECPAFHLTKAQPRPF